MSCRNMLNNHPFLQFIGMALEQAPAYFNFKKIRGRRVVGLHSYLLYTIKIAKLIFVTIADAFLNSFSHLFCRLMATMPA